MTAERIHRSPATHSAWLLLIFVFDPASLCAAEPRYEAGVRALAVFGNGEPANDILGGGVFVNRTLRDNWYAGVALERQAFDFERVARVVGIDQDPAESDIDSKATTTVLSEFVGQRFGRDDRGLQAFWTAGVGIGFPDVDDANGPTATGGSFDVTTDAGTEWHLLTSAGLRYAFSPRWAVDVAARLEHHNMDYQVRDRVSGNTAEVDSMSPYGIHFGVSYGF